MKQYFQKSRKGHMCVLHKVVVCIQVRLLVCVFVGRSVQTHRAGMLRTCIYKGAESTVELAV